MLNVADVQEADVPHVRYPSAGELEQRLNAIAGEGWRLVAVSGSLFVFEREE